PAPAGSSHRGLEFRHELILARIVMNSSTVNEFAPRTLFRWNLTLFTPASQIPPKCGAEGGMKDQSISISCPARWSFTFSQSTCEDKKLRSSLSAPTKLVPLSE